MGVCLTGCPPRQKTKTVRGEEDLGEESDLDDGTEQLRKAIDLAPEEDAESPGHGAPEWSN